LQFTLINMESERYSSELKHFAARSNALKKGAPRRIPHVTRQTTWEMKDNGIPESSWYATAQKLNQPIFRPANLPYSIVEEEDRYQKWWETYNKGMCPVSRRPPWAGVTRPSYAMADLDYGWPAMG
jgi:hypothetical protein